MKTQFWRSDNPREFKSGDIVCDKYNQSGITIVLDVTEEALWCIGLVHCAFTVNHKEHPIFPIWFDDMESECDPWSLTRLGNINDYEAFVTDKDIQNEVKSRIEYFKNNTEENDNASNNNCKL